MSQLDLTQKDNMSPPNLTGLCSLIQTLITASTQPKQQNLKLPPGPQALPIIGNLHMLGNLPHRSLQNLAQKYGPIMSMRLGNVPAIVVSSPKAAELFLKTHDTIFATRPKIQASEYLSYGNKDLAFAEYGPYWRHVRKLCTQQLLCPAKMAASGPLRKEEVGLLVESLKKAAAAREVVDLSEKVGQLTQDITFRMVLGRKKDDGFDLKGVIEEALLLAGAFNVSDYVPSLSPLDIQGFTKRLKKTSKTIDQLLEKVIGEHEQVLAKSSGKKGHDHHNDFLDVLLSLMYHELNPKDEQVFVIDRTNVKAILLDMIAGAFDTSANAIIWTLAELLRHPRVMKLVQQELQSVVGNDRMVEETDLPKLGYLNMVIKESFRLHPIAPLITRECMEDNIRIDGCDIPKESRIIINIWAIGRDPNIWSDYNVEEFYPERFANSDVELRGQDFQLLPFGSGRRRCPGMQLGLVTVELVLAQLLHCFDLELPAGMLPKHLHMAENFGLGMSKADRLLALLTYRL